MKATFMNCNISSLDFWFRAPILYEMVKNSFKWQTKSKVLALTPIYEKMKALFKNRDYSCLTSINYINATYNQIGKDLYEF